MRRLAFLCLPGVLMSQTPEPAAPAVPATPPKPHLVPAAKPGDLPCDSKDQKPVIIGATTREAIRAHREVFRDTLAKAEIPVAWRKRWADLSTPSVLVSALGSWCGDSQREVPDLLALEAEANPFVKVHHLGVYRDKQSAAEAWPQGVAPQPILKVPTFFLFVQQPGGGYALVDSIVENPPKSGQRMAEAILEMLEKVQ
jgi:thiol-disulfide isomerase/thioredoxin